MKPRRSTTSCAQGENSQSMFAYVRGFHGLASLKAKHIDPQRSTATSRMCCCQRGKRWNKKAKIQKLAAALIKNYNEIIAGSVGSQSLILPDLVFQISSMRRKSTPSANSELLLVILIEMSHRQTRAAVFGAVSDSVWCAGGQPHTWTQTGVVCSQYKRVKHFPDATFELESSFLTE